LWCEEWRISPNEQLKVISDFLEEYATEYDGQFDIEIGSWDCEDSPLGVCFYNRDEDPCMDHCLVCGDPDERK